MSSPADPPEVSSPDDLYSLPLETFTAARDQLAIRLADEESPDEAKAVSRLRKPSVAAWALNQASRQAPQSVERLIRSHQQLRSAGSADSLREASEERRMAVAELEAVAMAQLTAGGRPATGQTRDRIARTLLAVATDPEGEEDLAAGRLVRELEPSGAGWGEINLAPPPPSEPGVRAKAAAERARAKAERLSKEAESAEHQVELAKRALEEAKRRAKETRARADQAAADAEAATETLGER